MKLSWRDPDKELPSDERVVIIKVKSNLTNEVAVSIDSIDLETREWTSFKLKKYYQVIGWIDFYDLANL